MQGAVSKLVDDAASAGVSHSALKQMIRASFLERSQGLPREPVVYNNCYGGFDFSPGFDRFCRMYGDAFSEYDCVVAFGRFLCDNMGFSTADCACNTKRTEEILQQLHTYTPPPLPNIRPPAWETVGLQVASGVHSKLAVAWVPAGIDHEVTDYDGLQRVVW